MHDTIRERLEELKRVTEFTITEEHLKLLKRNFVGWEDCETGAPAIDCKRPYGNSDVIGDIFELLGWDEVDKNSIVENIDQKTNALRLHAETKIVLQICLITQSFSAGKYVRSDKYSTFSWERVYERSVDWTAPDWANVKYY